MVHRRISIAVLVYSLLLIIGGLMGYFKGHSLPSLIAGTGFGALLFICSILMFYHQKVAVKAALGLTAVLTITFLVRYIKSGAFVPAILGLISAAMLMLLLTKVVKWKKG